MVLKKSIVLILGVLCMISTSCLEVAKEISDWTEAEDINAVDGQTHFLGEDGIKLFLPKTFKKYTSIEYLALLDSLVSDNTQLEIERTRFRNLREMKGNHYIFFDNSLNATFTINTIPYAPISRQDAKYLLGIIRQSQREVAATSDLEYEKITAKHNNNGRTQVFKAIFKITDTKLQQQVFQNAYFVSSNKKTVIINLMTPFEVNFDPFLEKMIM